MDFSTKRNTTKKSNLLFWIHRSHPPLLIMCGRENPEKCSYNVTLRSRQLEKTPNDKRLETIKAMEHQVTGHAERVPHTGFESSAYVQIANGCLYDHAISERLTPTTTSSSTVKVFVLRLIPIHLSVRGHFTQSAR